MQETSVQFLGWEDPLEKGGLPTPVFWPGEFHGLYSPWGHKESDMTATFTLIGNSNNQSSVDLNRKEIQKRRDIYIYTHIYTHTHTHTNIQLIHFAVHKKLTQPCKAMLQEKLIKKKKERFHCKTSSPICCSTALSRLQRRESTGQGDDSLTSLSGME